MPCVSSFLASAAAQRQEYVLPVICQTVIVTRQAGRTPVPERVQLRALAAHQATMCIFLSITMLDTVVRELIDGGYSEDTPIAIVQKATWPDQRIVRGTLADICAKLKARLLYPSYAADDLTRVHFCYHSPLKLIIPKN